MDKPAPATGSHDTILPLSATSLSLAIERKLLIDDINLSFKTGCRTIILGPNGAGKSLLLRLLHGLIKPTGGGVTWAGRQANASIRARQAMVFQRPVLLRRSALANIEFVLKHRGMPPDQRKAHAETWLCSAGLGDLGATPARLLSGGEQQRLAIARGLAPAPDILFLDEPTANLDPAATLAVEKLILDADANGTKIIMVTHDIGQARRIGDEVLFLHRGHIEEFTPAVTFFSSPKSKHAAAFLEGRIVI